MIARLRRAVKAFTATPAGGGYDATDTRDRRRSVSSIIKHEDRVADERKRRILSSNAHDLSRNFAIAKWAIGKHIDFVTSHTFQASTDDEGFNRELEAAVKEFSTRQSFDVARRHPLRRAIRITESLRVKDGDALWLKVAPPLGFDRGKVQMIESDLIQTPKGSTPDDFDANEWFNGVRVDTNGAAREYAICSRTSGSQRELKRIVPARRVFHHAYYDRADQVRGISPISASLNWFRDTYEGFEYAAAKVKVGQLFGLAFKRESEFGFGGPGTAEAQEDTDDDGTNDARYEVDLGSGTFAVDLDPGDDVELIESKTPSTETVNFLKLLIHVALRALDIPFSFFDESFTNFYGSRGGLIQYLISCKHKRIDCQELLTDWHRWRLGLAVEDGQLQLPSGKDFSYVRGVWVPDGVPWWDPVKEVRGQAMSVAAGFSSPQRVCREIGTDFDENLRETAEAMRKAKEAGVPLVFADSTAFRPEITTEDSDVQ